jgi:hypothetical protein
MSWLFLWYFCLQPDAPLLPACSASRLGGGVKYVPRVRLDLVSRKQVLGFGSSIIGGRLLIDLFPSLLAPSMYCAESKDHDSGQEVAFVLSSSLSMTNDRTTTAIMAGKLLVSFGDLVKSPVFDSETEGIIPTNTLGIKP